MKILLAILLGGFFGYALYKVGATNPKKLLAMLRLEDLHLAKVILFAIGFASVLLSIANAIGIFDISHLSVKTLNLGVVIGGVIFGLGFGYAGTCPGTCVGASGTNNFKKGLSAIIGGLVGALTFTLSYGYLNNLGLIVSVIIQLSLYIKNLSNLSNNISISLYLIDNIIPCNIFSS